MTVQTFSGGAGCGKTFRLMQALSEYLIAKPLREGQKVLALTFMHGSRRRLEERLDLVGGLNRRHECSTVDSFAWRLVRRWTTLASQLGFGGIGADEYERVSEAAGALLEHEVVCRWVAATYPILLVDEAQDLTVGRLRIVVALSKNLEVLVAADEFQGLDEALRPNPACNWLAQAGPLENLTVPRRTEIAELLLAASAIRSGSPPASGKLFTVALTANAPLAGTWLTHALAWYGTGKKVAVITPTLGLFAKAVLGWVGANTTKKGNGPYNVPWERSEAVAADEFLRTLTLHDSSNILEIAAILRASTDSRAATDVTNWMDTQRRTRGREVFAREEISLIVRKSFSDRRRGQRPAGDRFRAMTVHGAKNREFDNVIVLWPAAVGGSDDQKRRLLYNAVTRAKHRCLVLVQAKQSIAQAPFA